MNPESRYPQEPHQTFRLECEQLTEKAFVEGVTALTAAENERLQALWRMFPDVRQEFDEMSTTVQRVKASYSPKTSININRTEAEWTSLENRINTRVRSTPNIPSSHHEGTPNLRLFQSLRKNVWTLSRIAAVFVLGLLAGRFAPVFFAPASNAQSLAFTQSSTFQPAKFDPTKSEQTDMQTYLKDAHLLMLGVMAMNAECGVSNPRALFSQRERCVELLSRSQRVQAGLSPSERVRVAHVMSEIESALAEFADVQPASCNASTIRQLQQRTDYALCEVSFALNEHESRKQ
jgi:hypothetical protein